MRNSDTAWHQESNQLYLKGQWSAVAVAHYWTVLPRQGVMSVDLSAVTQIDSSLMTLLLSLQPSVQSMRLVGVPKVVMSLLVLYELVPFFAQVEAVL